MMLKGQNGGSPSKNGSHDKEPPQKGGAETSPHGTSSRGGPDTEIEIVLTDRLDALERALGTVRRRGMTMQVHSLGRRGGELVLKFRAEAGATVHERWLAELAALVDVRQVNVAKL